MPIYHRLGDIPSKRHVQFRDESGRLRHEQLIGLRGFEGRHSLAYHIHPPTVVLKHNVLNSDINPKAASCEQRHRHIKAGQLKAFGDPISGRKPILFNNSVILSVCVPDENAMNYFYANGNRDEVIFVHDGKGKFSSAFGQLDYRPGDYIVIPKGTIYKLEADQSESNQRFFIIETPDNIELPSRYINEYGQLQNHSPYCARDFRLPQYMEPVDEKGEFEIRIKAWSEYVSYTYAYHPFDLVGWDGYLFPWIFNIDDFEPITGSLHMPPPIHQTFSSKNFVVCSFVPRLYDYHPNAVPVPYHHSNLQSEEVLYYVNGNFMSRRGIERGSITLHPAFIPHGPHPGTIESSLGKTRTDEIAVMVDTFEPLLVAENALDLDDTNYPYSWN